VLKLGLIRPAVPGFLFLLNAAVNFGSSGHPDYGMLLQSRLTKLPQILQLLIMARSKLFDVLSYEKRQREKSHIIKSRE
jgi:hypothetical protein